MEVHTELGSVEDVLVEDDGAGAEGDPCAARRLAVGTMWWCGGESCIRNVDCRVERGRLGRRLEGLWVHSGKHWQRRVAGSVHGGPDFLVGRHGEMGD